MKLANDLYPMDGLYRRKKALSVLFKSNFFDRRCDNHRCFACLRQPMLSLTPLSVIYCSRIAVETAGETADQHPHHRCQIERAGDAGDHTHHSPFATAAASD